MVVRDEPLCPLQWGWLGWWQDWDTAGIGESWAVSKNICSDCSISGCSMGLLACRGSPETKNCLQKGKEISEVLNVEFWNFLHSKDCFKMVSVIYLFIFLIKSLQGNFENLREEQTSVGITQGKLFISFLK